MPFKLSIFRNSAGHKGGWSTKKGNFLWKLDMGPGGRTWAGGGPGGAGGGGGESGGGGEGGGVTLAAAAAVGGGAETEAGECDGSGDFGGIGGAGEFGFAGFAGSGAEGEVGELGGATGATGECVGFGAAEAAGVDKSRDSARDAADAKPCCALELEGGGSLE